MIPILSLSLVGKPTDSQIMQKATGKNQFSINFDVSIKWNEIPYWIYFQLNRKKSLIKLEKIKNLKKLFSKNYLPIWIAKNAVEI